MLEFKKEQGAGGTPALPKPSHRLIGSFGKTNRYRSRWTFVRKYISIAPVTNPYREILMRKMLPLLAAAALLVPVSLVHAQQPQQQKSLDIYFIDTEGGQATLFVPPSGRSMLVDTGFPGNQGAATAAEARAPGITRDADRITAVLKQANVTVLDYVVITHYHGDHAGNAAELASRIPIRHFVDHGPYTVELQPNRAGAFLSYQPVREKAHTIVPKPGDRIPVAGLDVHVVSAAGHGRAQPARGRCGG